MKTKIVTFKTNSSEFKLILIETYGKYNKIPKYAISMHINGVCWGNNIVNFYDDVKKSIKDFICHEIQMYTSILERCRYREEDKMLYMSTLTLYNAILDGIDKIELNVKEIEL